MSERSHTVLIVDDTPSELAVVVARLEEAGFEIVVAPRGDDAVEQARLVMPDLILLDVLVAGVSGFETCRRLKASDLTREIPVIFMTSTTAVHDRLGGFVAGGVDYITKPFAI